MKRMIEKIKFSIIPCLSGAFTFFIFGTAELYISNKVEFWFSYWTLLPLLIFFGALTALFLSLIVSLIPQKAFKFGVAVLYGIAFAIYIQGNFLPNNYGQLNGDSIDWGIYQGWFVVNVLIWLLFTGGCFLLVWKFNNKALYCFKILCGIILATQLVTLTTIVIMQPEGQETDRILTTQGEFEISRNNNTFVFILDAFDSQLFCELLEKYPEEITENFKDFTFYHNTVGGATRTKYAIPYILSGQTNEKGISYNEYIKEAMDSSVLFNELKKDDYDSRFYTESSYINMDATKVIDNIENLSPRPTSKLGLTKDFLKLTAFRYAPDVLKKYFWLYSGDFDKWKGAEGDVHPYAIDDVAFNERLHNQGIICSVDKDVFRFYHLMGAHSPYMMNENGERLEQQGNEEKQSLGALRIVHEFILQLKEAGKYDDSAIFIIADHGLRGVDQNPVFMVKQRGVNQEFEQSDVPLSYKDLTSIWVDVLTEDYVDIDNKYKCNNERYFYVWDSKNSLAGDSIIEYLTYGKAYDLESFQLTGKEFHGQAGEVTYEYILGENLSFGKEATANPYCISGFSFNEGTHTWTLGNTSEMRFELIGNYNNLLLEFEYGVFDSSQSVKMYANDNLVADVVVTDGGKLAVFIPHEYVVDKTLELKFEFPNAISPMETGHNPDTRKLALSMRSIVISSTDNEE